MEILAVFLLFLLAGNPAATTANWLNRRRVRTEKNANDVLGVLEATTATQGKTEMFDDFHRLLNGNRFDGPAAKRKKRDDRPSNWAEVVGEARDLLVVMDYAFAAASFVYVARHVIAYYMWTGRFAGDLFGSSSSGEDGFCMLTALHDRGMLYDERLENAVCSLWFAANKRDTHWKCIGDLNEYKEHYREKLEPPAAESSLHPLRTGSPFPVHPFPGATPRIAEVVVEFSHAFCTRWRPFVGNFLLSPAASELRRRERKTVFVRHVFEKETCQLNLESDNTVTWKCDEILDSLEYGLEKHVIKRPGYSLVEIKKKFVDEYNDYKNAVNYYNIASEVVLFVSIREGNRMLKGIKHVVKRICKGNGVSANGILAMRSTLTAFKSVFDRLVTVMLVEKRIDVRSDPRKKTFDDCVNSLAKLLHVQDQRTDNGSSIVKMCRKVPRELKGKRYRVRLDYNAYNTLAFHRFYFTLPVLHVNQLYRFYAYDFV